MGSSASQYLSKQHWTQLEKTVRRDVRCDHRGTKGEILLAISTVVHKSMQTLCSGVLEHRGASQFKAGQACAAHGFTVFG